ncbi:uncharacterized protein LOC111324626 [Stylophora pistillata]|uniref:uncharacterized protein LOC111324626 n=1 Tax=Stylophora pistillata TaxID=50429 RepID=UPI000C0431A5|nr:uncharacterized protein LOC111324626 [Stylophora pistillata]
MVHRDTTTTTVDAAGELHEMARWRTLVDYSPDKMAEDPDVRRVIDPGSKILDIVNVIANSKDVPEGSKEHATIVVEIIRDFLQHLGERNVFKPLALAVVSRNDEESYVGASIAVSNFLRPLHLHKRIADFKKPSLRKAVIFNKPLITTDTQNWSSKARKRDGTYKPPCTNCRNTFKHLRGFIRNTEQGDGNRGTFLGACAEFCPVDKLLQDKTNDDQEIYRRLQVNSELSSQLYREFNSIARQCQHAIESVRTAHKEIQETVHIFGFKPECKFPK